MQTVQLKLREASAVLGVAPKDLQNLVQFGVLQPQRKDRFFASIRRFCLRRRWPFTSRNHSARRCLCWPGLRERFQRCPAENEIGKVFQCVASFASCAGERSRSDRNPAAGVGYGARSAASGAGVFSQRNGCDESGRAGKKRLPGPSKKRPTI